MHNIIPKEKIHVLLHLYEDINLNLAIDYWSKTLNIPRSQFAKPYIKESVRTEIDYKGYGRGTCTLRVFNTSIKEKISMSIEAMKAYSDDQILDF